MWAKMLEHFEQMEIATRTARKQARRAKRFSKEAERQINIARQIIIKSKKLLRRMKCQVQKTEQASQKS